LASHKKKNGTPTMGGLAFIIVPTLVYIIGSFFTPFKLDMNTMIILLAFVGYGVVGFIDDYIIVVQKNNEIYDGYTWAKAHYLYPVPIRQIELLSPSGEIASSVIYQNPYWPEERNTAAIE